MTHPARRVAVVGAGWAGLAAAQHLARHGFDITVFESSHEVGGRARTVTTHLHGAHSPFPYPLDNGQHLLLGAYEQTLDLIRELGLAPDDQLLRLPLRLESADGSFALRAPRLPSPLHAAMALLGSRGLTVKEKWAALRLMAFMRRQGWRTEPDQTVEQLLADHHQSTSLIRWLWTPLCLAALNTPPEEACAAMFAAVLRDSLDAPRPHSDLLLPRVDLSRLWPRQAAAHVQLRPGHTVRLLQVEKGGFAIDGENFESVVLAVPPYVAARLLPDHPQTQDTLSALRAFRYLPIATLTLRLAAPYKLPFPMLMLREDAQRGHRGQWVFDRQALLGLSPENGELAVVISAANDFDTRSREDWAALILEQLREQLRRPSHPPLPDTLAWELIVDKRATFMAVPSLRRPANTTVWPHLVLCGDWTDTGYPATLEGAVRSGRKAAEHLANTLR